MLENEEKFAEKVKGVCLKFIHVDPPLHVQKKNGFWA